jgi:hypothetical protein
MSEVPQLRAAVRASAERRCTRRRPMRRLARVTVVVAAVAAVLVVASWPVNEPAGEEVPATPTATPDTAASTIEALGRVYGVFRRPQTPSDRGVGELPRSGLALRLDRSGMRKLAEDGDFALYGIPALQDGHATLCVVTTRGEQLAGSGCGPFEPGKASARPRWSKTFYRPAPLYSLLVPDGTDTVDVHLRSGEVLTKRVQRNAVLFTAKGLDHISWRDAQGTVRRTRAAV